jgi:hypothetical protein
MSQKTFLLLFCTAAFLSPLTTHAGSLFDSESQVHNGFGCQPVHYQYDRRMIHAAEIAVARAHPNKTWHCWRYVKDALLDAGVVSSRPTTAWAKQAGDELCGKYGFKKLAMRNPVNAPVGAVIVYGGPDAGHVELRTSSGFVSDFISRTPYPRPLIGVYVKTT